MIAKNVVSLIGPDGSGYVKAIHPVCSGLHIPHIAPLATDPTLVPAEFPYLAKVSDKPVKDMSECYTLGNHLYTFLYLYPSMCSLLIFLNYFIVLLLFYINL